MPLGGECEIGYQLFRQTTVGGKTPREVGHTVKVWLEFYLACQRRAVVLVRECLLDCIGSETPRDRHDYTRCRHDSVSRGRTWVNRHSRTPSSIHDHRNQFPKPQRHLVCLQQVTQDVTEFARVVFRRIRLKQFAQFRKRIGFRFERPQCGMQPQNSPAAGREIGFIATVQNRATIRVGRDMSKQLPFGSVVAD